MSEYYKSLRSFEHTIDRDWSEATDPRLIAGIRLLAAPTGPSRRRADDLVALTLETAIKEADSRPAQISLLKWLRNIMARYQLTPRGPTT